MSTASTVAEAIAEGKNVRRERLWGVCHRLFRTVCESHPEERKIFYELMERRHLVTRPFGIFFVDDDDDVDETDKRNAEREFWRHGLVPLIESEDDAIIVNLFRFAKECGI